MDTKLSFNLNDDNFQLLWKNIKFTAFPGTKDEKIIINNVNGTLQSGQLMEFLGPSGSGLNSLLLNYHSK